MDKRKVLEDLLARANGKFVGVENVKKNGDVRRWSIASRLPKRPVSEIKGDTPRVLPPQMMTVYDTGKHAWRTLDCSTLNKVWCGDEVIDFTKV